MMPRLWLLLCSIFVISADLSARDGADFKLTPEIEVLLDQLDSLLAVSPEINAVKERHIDNLRAAYGKAPSLERQYLFAENLYDEYSAFDSDSAMAYADRALAIARRMNRPDLITDMELNRAYVFSATGLLDEAAHCLEGIDERTLSATMLWKYCDRTLFLATHRDQYIGGDGRDEAYSAVVDSMLQATIAQLKPSDPYYLWFVGWGHLKDRSQAERVIPEVKPVVDSGTFSTRNDAMNSWVLSKLYEYAGDYQEKFKYLILSAIADVRASNKEIASLEEIAQILYDMDELDRASAYVNYCIACANSYKSRVRLGVLAKLQDQTLNSIQRRSERQALQNHRYLTGLIAILLALLLAILLILRQMRLLRRSRREIHSSNLELRERVTELQVTREELNQANARLQEMYRQARDIAAELAAVNESKEVSIASIFTICSNYINKLDDFRKNIYRMIVARRYDDMLELTKSPELSQGEVKELYATFDKIFLEIYPEFVADFNALLRPDEQIVPRSDGSLTTELRIYALVRLGLNDSVKIAQFLHMSCQTVYNARQRTRNRAIVPKEQFAEAVRALGRHKV